MDLALECVAGTMYDGSHDLDEMSDISSTEVESKGSSSTYASDHGEIDEDLKISMDRLAQDLSRLMNVARLADGASLTDTAGSLPSHKYEVTVSSSSGGELLLHIGQDKRRRRPVRRLFASGDDV